MNAYNTIGYYFRMIRTFKTNSLSPNAYLVLLYLYRHMALTKENPVHWQYSQADVDLRTARTVHRELVNHSFIPEGPMGTSACSIPTPKSRWYIQHLANASVVSKPFSSLGLSWIIAV